MIIKTPLEVRVKQFKSLIRRPYLTMYALDGEFQNAPLRVLVADDGTTFEYIRSLAFGGQCDVSKKRLVSSVRAPRLARSDADLVVVGANQIVSRLFRRSGFHIVPKLISLYLPISSPPDEIIRNLDRNARKDLGRRGRRMTEAGFTYELTQDPAWFDIFYHEMYLPFATQRYGQLAMLYSYRRLKEAYSRGGAMIVKRNGETVGAELYHAQGQTLVATSVGVTNGDVDLAREGLGHAFYYYLMLVAYERGYAGVNFGYTRPFLSDGVLNHKLKWGMTPLNVDDHVGVFAVAVPEGSEAGPRFLSANPFYEITRQGIKLCDEYRDFSADAGDAPQVTGQAFSTRGLLAGR